MDDRLIIYHKGCWDGFCAAWLLHRVFADAAFVGAQYGDAPPDAGGRQVFIVDFCYARPVLLTLAHRARSLVVLDHHRSAQADLAGFAEEALAHGYCNDLPRIVFDLDKSGARLTWEFLVGEGLVTGTMPWLVAYTEDRDLWRWALPNTHEINAAIRSYPLTFEGWDAMDALDPHPTFTSEGAAILRRERQIVAEHVARASSMILAGWEVPVVNATTLVSEIAGELAVGEPFAVCWSCREDGLFVYSLRSDAQGMDVSEVAKQFGGGGHVHAAGFTADRLLG